MWSLNSPILDHADKAKTPRKSFHNPKLLSFIFPHSEIFKAPFCPQSLNPKTPLLCVFEILFMFFLHLPISFPLRKWFPFDFDSFFSLSAMIPRFELRVSNLYNKAETESLGFVYEQQWVLSEEMWVWSTQRVVQNCFLCYNLLLFLQCLNPMDHSLLLSFASLVYPKVKSSTGIRSFWFETVLVESFDHQASLCFHYDLECWSLMIIEMLYNNKFGDLCSSIQNLFMFDVIRF